MLVTAQGVMYHSDITGSAAITTSWRCGDVRSRQFWVLRGAYEGSVYPYPYWVLPEKKNSWPIQRPELDLADEVE